MVTSCLFNHGTFLVKMLYLKNLELSLYVVSNMTCMNYFTILAFISAGKISIKKLQWLYVRHMYIPSLGITTFTITDIERPQSLLFSFTFLVDRITSGLIACRYSYWAHWFKREKTTVGNWLYLKTQRTIIPLWAKRNTQIGNCPFNTKLWEQTQ